MNFKRCTAVLLCVAMLTSGGIFSTSVSAAGVENGVSATQSASNVIIDETGSIIKVTGDKDYFTNGVLDSKGYLKSYTNEMLTNIRFKTSFSSKYGKISSKSVMLYDSRGGKQTLKKDSNGYYTADTTRPCRWYKIVVQYKTIERKIYKRTIKIDNSKILIDGLKTEENRYINYDETSVYRVFNNYIIPSGSVTDINNSWLVNLLKQYEITTYSDFVKNGTNANWKSFYEQSDNGVYTWKTGEYALRQVKTGSDGKKLEIIWAHRVRVKPVTKEIDMKNVFKQICEDEDDFYSINIDDYKDILYDNDNYKCDLTYTNIFNVWDLLYVQPYELDGKIEYSEINSILDNSESYDIMRMVSVMDLSMLNCSLFDLDEDIDCKVYYSLGEVNDGDEIKWKQFKPVSSEYGENMTLGEYVYTRMNNTKINYRKLREKYSAIADEYSNKNGQDWYGYANQIAQWYCDARANIDYEDSSEKNEGFYKYNRYISKDKNILKYLDAIYEEFKKICDAGEVSDDWYTSYNEAVKKSGVKLKSLGNYLSNVHNKYAALAKKYEKLYDEAGNKAICSIKVKYKDIKGNTRSFTVKNVIVADFE